MFVTSLFLFAITFAIGGMAPTYALLAAAIGLAVYLAFQCLDALHGGVDAEMSSIASLLRRRLVLALAFSVTVAAGDARAAGTYYVDGSNPSCSNTGPGTQGTPYCTISAAVAAQAGPGTTIKIAPGTYREQVTIPTSGTAGSPLVIEGTGTFGQQVVIDGSVAYNSEAQWTLYQGTTWRASGVTWKPLMVLLDGQRLVPWGGSPDSVRLEASAPGSPTACS
jgi:pectin methylesterase-like acyl-CoA thioesterase